jgi:hypothetical protein
MARRMIALTDQQLQTIMATAADIAPERRDVFLQRVAAMLRLRRPFDDSDVDEIAKLATAGLVHAGRA